MNTEGKPLGAELHGEDLEQRRQAAARMGRARSERKTAAAQSNARKPRQRPVKPMAEIACACGAGDVTVDADGKPLHPTTCPRGRVIRYRLAKGLPLT